VNDSVSGAGPVPRRVIVADSAAWASPLAIRAALSQAWGDGHGVLVTGSRPSGADRAAAALWRSWGGQVQRHESRWALHRRPTDATTGAGRRPAAGADVCVSFAGGGRVAAHEQVATAVDRARRQVEALTQQRPPSARTAEDRTSHDDHHDQDHDGDQDQDAAGCGDGDEQGDGS
jgi:hypothetical protein